MPRKNALEVGVPLPGTLNGRGLALQLASMLGNIEKGEKILLGGVLGSGSRAGNGLKILPKKKGASGWVKAGGDKKKGEGRVVTK